MIKDLNIKDIGQVVKIHKTELSGFLSQMGEGFLKRFYEVSLDIPEMFTIVAKKNEQILGFAGAATSVNGLYKRVISRDFLPFVWLFLGYFITHPRNIVKMAKTMGYPGFAEDIPELLTIAVQKNYRGRGIGRKLFGEIAREMKKRGAGKFRVSVYDRLPANKFYEKMGCAYEKSFEFLGEKMNYYVYKFC